MHRLRQPSSPSRCKKSVKHRTHSSRELLKLNVVFGKIHSVFQIAPLRENFTQILCIEHHSSTHCHKCSASSLTRYDKYYVCCRAPYLCIFLAHRTNLSSLSSSLCAMKSPSSAIHNSYVCKVCKVYDFLSSSVQLFLCLFLFSQFTCAF